MYDHEIINRSLDYTRAAVGEAIEALIHEKREIAGAYTPLYDLLADYPFRRGKSLRPTMCISMARAVGGHGHLALTASSALELYHNAFLIHDDLEDGSESRRGKGTLHELVGVPRAVNVGDATNVLAVSLLVKNLTVIGVTRALQVLHEIENMARQSVEGQAMELDWVATNAVNLTDDDYFRMCVKKTCWYSFITPCRIGYIVGSSFAREEDMEEHLAAITRFGMALGIAFQIQDDLLNLEGDLDAYGKEIGGDIYEGKRTLMMNHVLAYAGGRTAEIQELLSIPRRDKTPDDIAFVLEEMERAGSFEHARAIARTQASKAAELLENMTFLRERTPIRPGEDWEVDVVSRSFLRELVNYVVDRNL